MKLNYTQLLEEAYEKVLHIIRDFNLLKNLLKKFLTTIAVVIAIVVLAGCGAFKNNVGKTLNAYSTGDYNVTVWSGGKAVRVYEIKNGFVNTEQSSDGWFFMYNGKLVRISGTVTIEQQ